MEPIDPKANKDISVDSRNMPSIISIKSELYIACEADCEPEANMGGIGIYIEAYDGVQRKNKVLAKISEHVENDDLDIKTVRREAVIKGLQAAQAIFERWESNNKKRLAWVAGETIKDGPRLITPIETKEVGYYWPTADPDDIDMDMGYVTQINVLTFDREIFDYLPAMKKVGKSMEKCSREFMVWRAVVRELEEYFVHKRMRIHYSRSNRELGFTAIELAKKGLVDKNYQYDTNIYRGKIKTLMDHGNMRMVPLLIFRRKEWEDLTTFEILVLELIDNAKLTLPEVAKELARNYNTVRTTYLRAKKKVKTDITDTT